MANLLQKIGPIAVVSVIFTWVCWPYITGSATSLGGKGNGNSVTLPDSLLSPGVKDPNERDPFQAVKSAAMNLLQNKLAGATDTSSEKTNAGNEEAAGANTSQGSSLVLTGVYIQGDKRMAILNGNLYRIGEKIKWGENGRVPWILKKVMHDRVVVAQGRKTKVVGMSFPAAPAKAVEPGLGESSNNSSEQPSDSSQKDSRPQLKSVMSLEELFEAVREHKKP